MASTTNTLIGNAWVKVAAAGETAVSAISFTDTAEWIVSDAGAPSANVTGHPMPRDSCLGISLTGAEELYLRNPGKGQMTAVVTAEQVGSE